MVSWPVIFVILVLPLVGALFIMLVRGEGVAESRNARWVALYTTLITFAVSLVLVWRFDPTSPEFQFIEKHDWLGGAISYQMGVDGVAVLKARCRESRDGSDLPVTTRRRSSRGSRR